MGYSNTSNFVKFEFRCAKSRCLDIQMKHFLSCLLYYLNFKLVSSCFIPNPLQHHVICRKVKILLLVCTNKTAACGPSNKSYTDLYILCCRQFVDIASLDLSKSHTLSNSVRRNKDVIECVLICSRQSEGYQD